jgi:hypothetical protein
MVRQHSKKHNDLKLRFETLERRTMLAGNVTVALHGADLVISGDNDANHIAVTETRVLGVLGYTITGQLKTHINGRSSWFVPAGLVTGNTKIDLASGSDSLVISKSGKVGVTFCGGLDIDFGYGATARAALKDVTVKGDLRIAASNADNAIALLTCVTVGGDACINTGIGADVVCIDRCSIGHDLNLETNDGNDSAAIKRTNVGNDISIMMGCGDDCLLFSNNSFTKATISGNSGTNKLAEAHNLGSLEIHDFTRI